MIIEISVNVQVFQTHYKIGKLLLFHCQGVSLRHHHKCRRKTLYLIKINTSSNVFITNSI